MGVDVGRFDIVLAALDPTVGHEIRKARPCLVISPDQMNRHQAVLIVAPLTTTWKHYPTRVSCSFQGRKGQVALDQLRAIDHSRIVRKLGALTGKAQSEVHRILAEMFAP
ncbi:MAG: type II toxin-antitoxin system PemK/MazF family toxin [Candidatus Xenobia bacterium]